MGSHVEAVVPRCICQNKRKRISPFFSSFHSLPGLAQGLTLEAEGMGKVKLAEAGLGVVQGVGKGVRSRL